jgi:hypothetical protein
LIIFGGVNYLAAVGRHERSEQLLDQQAGIIA